MGVRLSRHSVDERRRNTSHYIPQDDDEGCFEPALERHCSGTIRNFTASLQAEALHCQHRSKGEEYFTHDSHWEDYVQYTGPFAPTLNLYTQALDYVSKSWFMTSNEIPIILSADGFLTIPIELRIRLYCFFIFIMLCIPLLLVFAVVALCHGALIGHLTAEWRSWDVAKHFANALLPSTYVIFLICDVWHLWCKHEHEKNFSFAFFISRGFGLHVLVAYIMTDHLMELCVERAAAEQCTADLTEATEIQPLEEVEDENAESKKRKSTYGKTRRALIDRLLSFSELFYKSFRKKLRKSMKEYRLYQSGLQLRLFQPFLLNDPSQDWINAPPLLIFQDFDLSGRFIAMALMLSAVTMLPVVWQYFADDPALPGTLRPSSDLTTFGVVAFQKLRLFLGMFLVAWHLLNARRHFLEATTTHVVLLCMFATRRRRKRLAEVFREARLVHFVEEGSKHDFAAEANFAASLNSVAAKALRHKARINILPYNVDDEFHLIPHLKKSLPKPIMLLDSRLFLMLRKVHRGEMLIEQVRVQNALLLSIGLSFFLLSAMCTDLLILEVITVETWTLFLEVLLLLIATCSLLNSLVHANDIMGNWSLAVLLSWRERLDGVHSAVLRVSKLQGHGPFSEDWLKINSYFEFVMQKIDYSIDYIKHEETPLSFYGFPITQKERNRIMLSLLSTLGFLVYRYVRNLEWLHYKISQVGAHADALEF